MYTLESDEPQTAVLYYIMQCVTTKKFTPLGKIYSVTYLDQKLHIFSNP